MPIIDNLSQTMQDALINALESAERVDIEVAFFYFSGWRLLAEHLEDKRVRILVGKHIDPDAVPDLLIRIKHEGENVDLDAFQPRKPVASRLAKRQNYIDGFTRLSNESALFDDTEVQKAYKLLEGKIADGTLEIKLTGKPEHGKMYILHNKREFSQNGDYPGTVFMGSSNFTFQGLINQGELNERQNDKFKYEAYTTKFEEMWADSENIDIATIANKDEFISRLRSELWIYANPSPYAMYIRVLHELFGQEHIETIETPEQITSGRYTDLEYQIDAVKSVLDKLEKYDGVILADVVGLGKSIVASAVAANLGISTIVIAPPHLKDQWEDYQEDFRLPGARVFSSGTIETVYERYKDNDRQLLIIIDEAHRFRNEDTDHYRMLHHICSSHPQNKVVLLTATPFNNDPKDVFALVKLFQIPGQSTIRSVDNLSLRFRELIDRYKKLNRDRRKGLVDQSYIDNEADEISLELRRLIENVVVRRSRLDLRAITRYREDLERQKIDFAEVEGPQLLQYELGELLGLYHDTLVKLTEEEENGGFIGARYKPATYVKDDKKAEFLEEYKEEFDETDLQTAQRNLAEIMRRLLVMRFESSKDAFRSTIQNMISSTELIQNWWETLGRVPIMKKGSIPDPELIFETSSDDLTDELRKQTAEEELQRLREDKGLIAIDSSWLNEKFIQDVKKDRKLLGEIYEQWFGEQAEEIRELDPKLDQLKTQLDHLLAEDPKRKIVIFSSYADTVNYLYGELIKRGAQRVMKYTSGDASKEAKKTIRHNFDAGIKASDQEDDYDVLIATDALSEGFNLHRAGVIVNYDIPYNPTRVIQRVGRINRINKKVFDKLYIYNYFPTETGESEIRIKQISTLKIRLINAVVGSDTQTLTSDEKLQTFFKDEFRKAEEETEAKSWDADYREDYDLAKKNESIVEEALQIKPRSRVLREGQGREAVVAFGKKGEHAIFALKEGTAEVQTVAAERALEIFRAEPDETGKPADAHYDQVFKLVRDTLFAKHALPKVSGRRQKALTAIKFLEEKMPKAQDYCRDLAAIITKYDGINEGDLKSITQLTPGDLEEMYKELRAIVPEHQVEAISQRAARLEGEYETIVLSEEIRP